jgi:hypothetical protein
LFDVQKSPLLVDEMVWVLVEGHERMRRYFGNVGLCGVEWDRIGGLQILLLMMTTMTLALLRQLREVERSFDHESSQLLSIFNRL